MSLQRQILFWAACRLGEQGGSEFDLIAAAILEVVMVFVDHTAGDGALQVTLVRVWLVEPFGALEQ